MRKTLLATALALCCATLAAAPLGALRSLDQHSSALRLHTDRGHSVQLQLLRPDLLRILAGDPDAGSKAAPIVLKTDYAPVAYRLSDQGAYQLLQTDALALRIYKAPLRFALYRADNASLLWEERQPLDISKTRSVQTLSSTRDEQFYGGGQQNGRFAFKGRTLEISYSGGWEEGDRPSPAPFYMSSRGYGVLRHTWSNGSYDFRAADAAQLSHREGRFDAYYFVGSDIRQVLALYTELTGRAPMPPRWAFEYGDADCYNDGDNAKKPGTVPAGWSDGPSGTTPDVVLSVAAKYREHDMPGGWILPNDGYGCGYTALPETVQGLARHGFKTGLWTEDGVDKIKWEVGTAGTRAQKLDVAWTGKGYQFALDANHAAAQGILANSDSRPFIWTVMGWAGVQRYAVTWTGDQSGSWDYIRWHIPTLIGSGLSGQAYATGDVDGIFGGSPETYTRDLQWKAFTPVLMGMSGWSRASRKHPWWFDEPYRSINRDYLKLKLRLTPYMVGLAREAEQSGAPLVRGLAWDHPHDALAQSEAVKYQFFLGRDFLVAPVYRSQTASQGWRRGVYLPQGRWIDYWDGRVVEAGPQGRRIDVAVGLDKTPVFVRAGAIIPMYPAALYDGQVPKDVLTLDIYPQGVAEYTLYEDDGSTRQYRQGAFSQQRFAVHAGGDIQVEIGAAQGSYAGMLEQRAYLLQLHTRQRPQAVLLDGAAVPFEFDPARYGVVRVQLPKGSVRQAHTLVLKMDPQQHPAATADYPAAPDPGRAVPADALLVINRPPEEPGHRLEQAFDGKPETWFRTIRDQSVKTGGHEFTLSLGERRLIDGFEIAPRNDKSWKYGQARDVEVYLADANGEWGAPAWRGRLKLEQGMQRISFPARAGSLLRFRVLSTQDMGVDPMVTAADAAPAAFHAQQAPVVTPLTISELRVLEAPPITRAEQQQFLRSGSRPLRMNGLAFQQGLALEGARSLRYKLEGDWRLFRADVGVDDRCRSAGSQQFQVWGDGRLLFDSGRLSAPAVVKPEIDVRGLRSLELRTLLPACSNWANASLIGYAGDSVRALRQ